MQSNEGGSGEDTFNMARPDEVGRKGRLIQKIMKRTDVRFCDISFGTEFCFCDPDSAPGMAVPRFKKLPPDAHRPSGFARYVNLTTGREMGVGPNNTPYFLPVWVQTTTVDPAATEALQFAIRRLTAENKVLSEKLGRVKRQMSFISDKL